MTKKILGYKLVPVYDDVDWLVNAAMMDCCLTGETLSGHSGGGMFISPTIVDKIRRGKIQIIDMEQSNNCS